MCEEYIEEARNNFMKDEKTATAYSKLVNLMSHTHQKDSRHEKFVLSAMELIVEQLSKSLSPGNFS